MNEKKRPTLAEILARTHDTYDRIMGIEPISKAHLVGTFNQIDRSKQYTEPDAKELLHAVNSAWSKIRACESELGKKQEAIEALKRKVAHYRIANSLLTSILTVLAFKGLEALLPYLVHH